MDHRRPVRPPSAARRALFHSSTRRQNPLNANHSKPSVHIASEEPDPQDDFVERDGTGNYKLLAPTTAMKVGISNLTTEADEEADQENQMIALYGKQNCHWDQAAILEEIKVALQASLERKVQSLESDRWMFEGEGKCKG